VLVPGAIAATSPASKRKKPAEAARPPLGSTGNDRHWRGDDFRDGVPHRVHQPAGRIQPDDHQTGGLLPGLRQRASHNLRGYWVHHSIDVHRDNLRRAARNVRRKR